MRGIDSVEEIFAHYVAGHVVNMRNSFQIQFGPSRLAVKREAQPGPVCSQQQGQQAGGGEGNGNLMLSRGGGAASEVTFVKTRRVADDAGTGVNLWVPGSSDSAHRRQDVLGT